MFLLLPLSFMFTSQFDSVCMELLKSRSLVVFLCDQYHNGPCACPPTLHPFFGSQKRLQSISKLEHEAPSEIMVLLYSIAMNFQEPMA